MKKIMLLCLALVMCFCEKFHEKEAHGIIVSSVSRTFRDYTTIRLIDYPNTMVKLHGQYGQVGDTIILTNRFCTQKEIPSYMWYAK